MASEPTSETWRARRIDTGGARGGVRRGTARARSDVDAQRPDARRRDRHCGGHRRRSDRHRGGKGEPPHRRRPPTRAEATTTAAEPTDARARGRRPRPTADRADARRPRTIHAGSPATGRGNDPWASERSSRPGAEHAAERSAAAAHVPTAADEPPAATPRSPRSRPRAAAPCRRLPMTMPVPASSDRAAIVDRRRGLPLDTGDDAVPATEDVVASVGDSTATSHRCRPAGTAAAQTVGCGQPLRRRHAGHGRWRRSARSVRPSTAHPGGRRHARTRVDGVCRRHARHGHRRRRRRHRAVVGDTLGTSRPSTACCRR